MFRNYQRIYKREGIDQTSTGRNQVVFFSANKKTLHASSSNTDTANEQKKIWIKFRSPAGYHRQLLVTADARTTSGFDLGFDAPLIDDNSEDMYWLMGEAELVIQGVPDFNLNRSLPLGVKTSEGGKFTISIDDLENVTTEFSIFVKDNKTEVYHNLQKSVFSAEVEKGNIHDRYSIVFSDNENPDEETEGPGEGEDDGDGADNGEGDGDGDGTDIGLVNPEQPLPTPPGIELQYSSKDKEIVIKNAGLLPVKKIVLYNSLGQELRSYNSISVQRITELPVEVPSKGMYFVRVYLENSTSILKFLVD